VTPVVYTYVAREHRAHGAPATAPATPAAGDAAAERPAH
jgi:hypothetical protein